MKTSYTDKDLSTLRGFEGSLSLQEMADLIGRNKKSVYNACRKYDIPFRDSRKDNPGAARDLWTPDDLAYLEEHAPFTPTAVMAEHLGVSVRSVRDAMYRYKIKGRGYNRKQTPEEIERRVSKLRGIKKVDRDALRECSECGEMKPVFLYPSEETIQSSLCEDCRKSKRREKWRDLSTELKKERNNGLRGKVHGLSHEQYDELLENQNNSCALCLRTFVVGDNSLRPEVDHDHSHCPGKASCGECVRGLLCHDCNLSLGRIEAMLEHGATFGRLAAYLR